MEMKKTVILSVLLLVLVLSGGLHPAWAGKAGKDLDMRYVTCADITSEDEAAMMLFWLDGYISAESGDTRFSDAWVDQLADHLEKECGRDDKQFLLSIVKSMVRN